MMFVAIILLLATAAPQPSATATPAASLGPVLVNGKTTFGISFSGSQTKTATASQINAPGNAYFIAVPGMLCTGTVTVAGTSQSLPGSPITSTGQFTFTRTGSPVGCAITISSSAGGATATIVFQ